MKIKTTILTEGSSTIGYGHITRCLAIAEALKKAGTSVVTIINGDRGVKQNFLSQDIAVENWLYEISAGNLPEQIKNSSMIIVDSYLADIGIYKTLKNYPSVLVALDDNLRLNYPADIIINGTIGAEKFPYKKTPRTKYLLGTKYVPLRKEFSARDLPHIKDKLNKPVRNIMITFGAEDALNLTPVVLKNLSSILPYNISKSVVIGMAYKHNIDVIRRHADKNTLLFIHPDASGMRKIMSAANIAISAAGQTLYELSFMGIPTLAIGVAENQKRNLSGWSESGFAINCGQISQKNFSDAEVRLILSQLTTHLRQIISDPSLRRKMALRGLSLVDGKGAQRISKAILDHVRGK